MTSPDSRFTPTVSALALRHLQTLGESSSGIQVAVLTSEDGFEIATYRGAAIAGRIAAMSSSLQALSEALVREAGLGGSRNVIIEAKNGTVLVLGLASTSPSLSLSVVAASDETLGKLLWAARDCCRALEQDLSQVLAATGGRGALKSPNSGAAT
jgi:predicted regulator of Ras-like GTPase activity (Roadblock/LC7/MglB family)